ncbi:MAG: glycosyltransferase, partial [Candidatus Omnitrophica bacterium]|nr:glycosyltransferase [Candidatus Omnitrophota bacterium]
MHILFITSTLPRYKNDHQAPFVLEQAVAWKKTFSNDDVTILAPDHRKAQREEVNNNVFIRRFSYFWPRAWQTLTYPAITPNIQKRPWLILLIPAYILFQVLAVRKSCKNNPLDILYAHWIIPQGITAYLAKRFFKIPYILQNHSRDLEILMKIPLIGKIFARAILRNAQAIFCVNNYQKIRILQLFDKNDQDLPNDKIKVLPMGLNISKKHFH